MYNIESCFIGNHNIKHYNVKKVFYVIIMT